jgi:hypothetical protein
MIKIHLIILLTVVLFITTHLSAANSEIIPTFKAVDFIESKRNNYTVFFSPSANEIKLNHYFDIKVQVKSALQQAIKFPLQLDIDVGMKAHHHGMNVKPYIENLGHGIYQIRGMLLHMPGKWEVTFKLKRGILTDSATTSWAIHL